MVSQTERAKGEATPGGLAFCLKPSLLGNTVRSRGWERICGQQVVDDLVVPAHGGEEGGVERRPSSIPHKVSVGSASEPRRGKASVSVAGTGEHPPDPGTLLGCITHTSS